MQGKVVNPINRSVRPHWNLCKKKTASHAFAEGMHGSEKLGGKDEVQSQLSRSDGDDRMLRPVGTARSSDITLEYSITSSSSRAMDSAQSLLSRLEAEGEMRINLQQKLLDLEKEQWQSKVKGDRLELELESVKRER